MKKNSNRHGFTLIELIAVIVVVAIIVLIATNGILPQVRKARENAFIDEVYNYMKAANYQNILNKNYAYESIFNFPNSGIESIDKEPDGGYIRINKDNEQKVSLWNNKLKICAVKDYNEDKVYINRSLKTKEDCESIIPNITDSTNITVASITGEESKVIIDGVEQDAVVNAKCYNLQGSVLVSFDTKNCGKVAVIPNKINGVQITGFQGGFGSNLDIESIYIMENQGITNIGGGFFANNQYLKKISIISSNSIARISEGAAAGVSNLESIELSNMLGLTDINNDAFSRLPNLKKLTLSNLPSLTSFSSGCFRQTGIKELTIENLNGLTSLDNGVFQDSSNLTTVTIKNNENLKTITGGAFNNSTNLRNIYILNNPKLESVGNAFSNIQSFNNVVFASSPKLRLVQGTFANQSIANLYLNEVDNYQILDSRFLENVRINYLDLSSTKINTIRNYSIVNCQIMKLSLPDTITNIENGAFMNSNITSIDVNNINKCILNDKLYGKVNNSAIPVC